MNVSEVVTVLVATQKAYRQVLGLETLDDSVLVEPLTKWVEFKVQNLNTTPEDLHNNWLKVMANDGWVYGPTRDVTQKEHPDLVRYNRLPESQRKLDDLMNKMMESLLT